ncbi:hypothetical protein ACH5RR_035118 [Cinchona calisaya]|uniref:EXS domain-containing protein n=1 Tax=Cinchona calisaya TaxID=153742 RepID=A0ABD2YHC1_9GENT
MFGGPVSVPTNSPHLRMSSSRPFVYDLGTSELRNSAEEGFLLSVESNEMKGISTPLSSASISPSPVLLWRLRVLLFFIWGFICFKIGWDSVMRMSVDLRDLFLYEAFLYYNPLLLVTMAVWLWGVNLWVFQQSNVNYAKFFDLDQNHLTHREIWKCATWMTIIVPSSMTAYLYLYSHGEVALAASQPVLLYAAVAMAFLSPFDLFFLSSRYFLLRTLWRIVLPLQAISFADFFLANILTSMSKIFSDLERSVCQMVHRQADSVCGSHSVGIPIILVLPYLFRLFQCLRQYKDTKERNALFNDLMYEIHNKNELSLTSGLVLDGYHAQHMPELHCNSSYGSSESILRELLLRLYPDKLQQKGAHCCISPEVYSKQVFDILQEDWDHFNSFGAI